MPMTKAQSRKEFKRIVRVIIDNYNAGYDDDTLAFILVHELKHLVYNPANLN